MQRVNECRGSRGADSQRVCRGSKECRGTRGAEGQGEQGVEGCRGSRVQRVNECRGSRGAEGQRV